jgi:hypothetical protein
VPEGIKHNKWSNKMNDNIRTRDKKTFTNEYGWEKEFSIKHWQCGLEDHEQAQDIKLEKPIKLRNFESLINAFEALPEDVRSAEIIIKGTPRRTLQNSEIFNFPLITHIINQMIRLDETKIKFEDGHIAMNQGENYYISPLDKYIECDFSTFMASTASKWHKPEALNIFWVDIIRGKKQNFDLTYNDIIKFLKCVYKLTKNGAN